jgi:hypothetical protein
MKTNIKIQINNTNQILESNNIIQKRKERIINQSYLNGIKMIKQNNPNAPLNVSNMHVTNKLDYTF